MRSRVASPSAAVLGTPSLLFPARDKGGPLGGRAIGLVLVGFVALRLATLWRLPPYFDESAYALQGWAAASHSDQWFAALPDGKGPLLNWLTAIPILLGIDPLVAVRLVATAASSGTIWMVGLLGRRLFGAATGVVAMAVYALLPFVVVQGAMGFYEPLVGFFAAAAFYFQLELVREPTVDRAVLLGAALGGGLLTKATGDLVVVMLPLGLLVFPFDSPDRRRRLLRWAGGLVIALAIAGLLYSIMMTSPLYYQAVDPALRAAQYNSPAYAVSHVREIIDANWPSYRVELVEYLTVPLVLLLGGGLGYGLARCPRPTLLLAAWAVVPLAASTLISNKPLARYYLPWIAPFVLFIADAAVGVVPLLHRVVRVPERRRAGLVAGLAAFVALPALTFDVSFVIHPGEKRLPAFDDREFVADWPAGGGVAAIASRIDELSAGRGGAIAFSPPGTWSEALPLLLGDPDRRRYVYLDAADGRAASAQFVVEYAGPVGAMVPCVRHSVRGCARIDPSLYRLVDAIPRPRFGTTLRLFARTGS